MTSTSALAFSDAATRLSGLMTVLFHWTPDQFWRSTPQEVAAIFAALAEAQGEGAVEPPDTETLSGLMARFPDQA